MFHSLSAISAPLVIVAALITALPAHAQPKWDSQKSCEASYAADTSTGRERIPRCVADEKQASDELTSNWAKYPVRERDHCQQLATLGGTPSYVEMLTCLQIARETQTLPTDIKKSGLPK